MSNRPTPSPTLSVAYCDHAAVVDELREYRGKRTASQSMLGLASADFSADLPDAYGRPQPAFRLPKRECLILLTSSPS